MLVSALGNIWNIYLVSALQLFYFLSGCRFHVHANQRRAAGGGFSAKVWQFSFLLMCLLSLYVAFVIKNLLIPVGT